MGVRDVRLLILDVDGVLTDGRIAIDDNGVERKFFDVRDGMGLALLREAGIERAIISGRHSKAVEHRAQELGITKVFLGKVRKKGAYDKILLDLGLSDYQVAYIGDDLIDLPLLKRVGFAVCPSDAHPALRTHVHWITKSKGGHGAVRELCEYILKSQDLWEELIRKWFSD